MYNWRYAFPITNISLVGSVAGTSTDALNKAPFPFLWHRATSY